MRSCHKKHGDGRQVSSLHLLLTTITEERRLTKATTEQLTGPSLAADDQVKISRLPVRWVLSFRSSRPQTSWDRPPRCPTGRANQHQLGQHLSR